jgi:hypothetical protein
MWTVQYFSSLSFSRRLGDEMRNMLIEKSRQREQELHLEMERLQAEIKAMQKTSESANISQQLSKEVRLEGDDNFESEYRAQFHQRSTRIFCAGRLTPVKYKPKT